MFYVISFYQIVVRLTMMFSTKCETIKNQHGNRLSVQMKILSWMCGKTRRNKIINGNIKKKVRITWCRKKACEICKKL